MAMFPKVIMMALKFSGVACAILLLLLPFISAAQADLNANVEAIVRSEFSNVPVMIAIAKCESEMRQFGKSGTALHGGAGGAMVGVFQIHETVHRAFANSKGMDIDTLDGNIAYARYLYQTEGTKPWVSSSSCWQHAALSIQPATSSESSVAGDVAMQELYSPPTKELSSSLRMGDIHPEVKSLQILLNGAGFVLAESGPGSSGNETNFFGALTRAAVQKMQCNQKIICLGDEKSTGYGLVGPRTRTALMSFAKNNVVAQPDPVIVGNTALPTSTIATSSVVTSVGGSPTQAAEIERLQSQIQELQKRIAELMDT